MKRTLALILAFLMLASLVSCTQTPAEGETATVETKKTEEEKKETKEDKEDKKETVEVVYMTVENPLKKAELDAIPVAKSTMSMDQLRQICVDYFNLAMSFRYIPNTTTKYEVPYFKLTRILDEGKIYGGLPYINHSSGNLYRMMEFYDENTGILDMTLFKNDMKLFGNDCSLGADWGWARVVNSAKLRQTWWMVEGNGYLKLGPYTYDTTIENFDESANPPTTRKEITRTNGEQVMYESYALMQKADGIVNDGHARMAVENAHVVRNADNTINGEESYIVFSEQVTYNTSEKYMRVQSDGTIYYIAGGQNIKYTFANLYETGYLPFTFAEFLGTDPIEDGAATLDYTGSTITPKALQQTTLTTNYVISDVHFIVTDSQGNTALRFAKRMTDITNFTFSMGTISDTYFQKFADGTHTLEIKVQMGNGECLTAYKGTLVKE